MKYTHLFIHIMVPVIAVIFCSCSSKSVTNNEIKNAYLAWFHATSTLTTVVNHTENDNSIEETLENTSKTYTRYTKFDRSSQIVTVTHTFNGYQPSDFPEVTIKGSLVQKVDDSVYTMNGTLTYDGCRPSKLTFINVEIEEVSNDTNSSQLYPIDGSLVADDRTLSCMELVRDIWK